ncbi:hypothetical protein WICMUC_002381 [Wickerhamomyces mucosus]|uniref:Uncharacterized protein n=1 Tax=Wickerhamomyces mucosus TaxID=1378264 RepID=A0A9P8TEQ7_9ASCO|nr:hypothetical protein WICMUC_002381 [Wickerhamomyces mucosus]
MEPFNESEQYSDQSENEDSIEYETGNKEEIYSFDLPNISVLKHVEKRNETLVRLLNIHKEEKLKSIFLTILGFCDPITQPMENDQHILSIDFISNILIGLHYPRDKLVGEYHLSLQLYQLIKNSLILLNCEDEIKLRSLNNSDSKVDWKLKLHVWAPLKILKTQDVNLLYSIIIISIYTIFKLYRKNFKDICLNPFLQNFLKLWKIFTNVLLLSLEIDRRIELEPNEITPSIIKTMIRGSSAIRYVLATILNDDYGNRYHDYHHVQIQDFFSPYARRNGDGALIADVRWYIGAMLALSFELNEVIEILIDLEPNDKYDEDVKYIFDYEFDDYNHVFTQEESLEIQETGVIIYQDEDDNFHKITPMRCTCEFLEEEEEEKEKYENQQHNNKLDVSNFHNHHENVIDESSEYPYDENKFVKAIRSDSLEFDEQGRDWRDIPRDSNVNFNKSIDLDNEPVFKLGELIEIFDEMSEEPIDDSTGQKIIFTIAKSIKFDDNNESSSTLSSSSSLTKDIYEIFESDPTKFERMMVLNPEICFSILDELFMTKGYRRVLIWFLTHLEISYSLIEYINQLIENLRGEFNKKFKFSRIGGVILSEIEKSMLLHEFINTAAIKFSNPKSSDLYNLPMFSLMIKGLIEKKLIDLNEYKFEISNLFINYIITNDVKEIFFDITKFNESLTNDSKIDQKDKKFPMEFQEDEEESIYPNVKFKKFNPILRNNLNNILKIYNNGENESMLFQPFLEIINLKSNDDNNDEVENDYNEDLIITGEIIPSFKHLNEEKTHELLELSMQS